MATPGLCAACLAAKHRDIDSRRGNPTQRGYDWRWRKASKQFLRQHPLCEDCEAEGAVRSATVVDHKIPHKGDPVLFWDMNNWRAVCKPHHDRKTAKEDGGFGRGEGASNL